MTQKVMKIFLIGAVSLLVITPALAQKIYELNNYEKNYWEKIDIS